MYELICNHKLPIYEMIFKKKNRKGFLHWIVTRDEKWLYHERPKSKNYWISDTFIRHNV